MSQIIATSKGKDQNTHFRAAASQEHAADGVFDDFPKISDHFPKISEDFPKLFRKPDERSRTFPRISENFRRCPKIAEDCRRLSRKTRRCFDDRPTNLSTI